MAIMKFLVVVWVLVIGRGQAQVPTFTPTPAPTDFAGGYLIFSFFTDSSCSASSMTDGFITPLGVCQQVSESSSQKVLYNGIVSGGVLLLYLYYDNMSCLGSPITNGLTTQDTSCSLSSDDDFYGGTYTRYQYSASVPKFAVPGRVQPSYSDGACGGMATHYDFYPVTTGCQSQSGVSSSFSCSGATTTTTLYGQTGCKGGAQITVSSTSSQCYNDSSYESFGPEQFVPAGSPAFTPTPTSSAAFVHIATFGGSSVRSQPAGGSSAFIADLVSAYIQRRQHRDAVQRSPLTHLTAPSSSSSLPLPFLVSTHSFPEVKVKAKANAGPDLGFDAHVDVDVEDISHSHFSPLIRMLHGDEVAKGKLIKEEVVEVTSVGREAIPFAPAPPLLPHSPSMLREGATSPRSAAADVAAPQGYVIRTEYGPGGCDGPPNYSYAVPVGVCVVTGRGTSVLVGMYDGPDVPISLLLFNTFNCQGDATNSSIPLTNSCEVLYDDDRGGFFTETFNTSLAFPADGYYIGSYFGTTSCSGYAPFTWGPFGCVTLDSSFSTEYFPIGSGVGTKRYYADNCDHNLVATTTLVAGSACAVISRASGQLRSESLSFYTSSPSSPAAAALSTGETAGIVAGGIAVLALIAFLVYYKVYRPAAKSSSSLNTKLIDPNAPSTERI